MNRLAASAVTIAADELQWARSESARRGGRLIELLEERLACGPREFVAGLSAALHMPAVSLDEMLGEHPAFELIPYAEASRRGCVALRSTDGALSVVLGDPYDLDTQDWIEDRLRTAFRYRIAHRLDVAAYLSQQEAHLRALDGRRALGGAG